MQVGTATVSVIQEGMSLAYNCMLLRVVICDGGQRYNSIIGHSFPIKVTSSVVMVVICEGGHRCR